MNGIRWIAAVAILAATVLVLPGVGFAQDGALNIVIVEGEGAVNNIRQRVAREPIVRVEDENRKPIAGATVVFLLPNDGAGGAFPGGDRMLTVQTNQQGEAAARGLRPNNVAGDFTIRVTASFEGRTGSAIISQSNALAGAAAGAAGAAAGMSTAAKILTIVGIAAVATAGGVYAATRDGGNGGAGAPGQPPRPTTGITIGSPTVGAP